MLKKMLPQPKFDPLILFDNFDSHIQNIISTNFLKIYRIHSGEWFYILTLQEIVQPEDFKNRNLCTTCGCNLRNLDNLCISCLISNEKYSKLYEKAQVNIRTSMISFMQLTQVKDSYQPMLYKYNLWPLCLFKNLISITRCNKYSLSSACEYCGSLGSIRIKKEAGNMHIGFYGLCKECFVFYLKKLSYTKCSEFCLIFHLLQNYLPTDITRYLIGTTYILFCK